MLAQHPVSDGPLRSSRAPRPPSPQIHKLMAGLVDQHQLVGDTLALSMARDLADYFCDRIDSVLRAKGYAHWQVSVCPFGC